MRGFKLHHMTLCIESYNHPALLSLTMSEKIGYSLIVRKAGIHILWMLELSRRRRWRRLSLASLLALLLIVRLLMTLLLLSVLLMILLRRNPLPVALLLALMLPILQYTAKVWRELSTELLPPTHEVLHLLHALRHSGILVRDQ